MSSARTNFRMKLNRIYQALCAYTDDVIKWDEVYLASDMKLRYAIILQAVDDLHFGSVMRNEQEEAIEYFKSQDFLNHLNDIPVPKWIIEKIIHSPEEYASHIIYKEDEPELENDIYI